MKLLDPNDPPNIQIEKQAKIIDALMRRAGRQSEIGTSAFQAFESAIELQQKLDAQTRDLARAADALASARHERERTRQGMAEALSSMEEGFAFFVSGELDLCNRHFGGLMPDIDRQMRPGLRLERFLSLVSDSSYVRSTDRPLVRLLNGLEISSSGKPAVPVVIELSGDRWYQMSAQRTSGDNSVVLLTEISALVRRNRRETESLIDRQADYLQAVFQNMTSGVCTFSAQGEVKMRNARFQELLGLPATILEPGTSFEKVLGYLRLQGMVAPNREDRFRDWRQELLKEGALRKRVRHGSDRVLDLQVSRLTDGGFLVELKDVTLEARATETLENRVKERTAELTRANEKLVRQYEEKARVEEELRLAKERAEAAVSSKTRFLAAASHDLLQPINAAQLLISTLRQTLRDSNQAPLIERLDGAFRSAEQLLHSLLDISRLESPDPDAVTQTDVSLGAIMESVHADQTPLAGQRNVELGIVHCSATVHSDPVYLLRSIQNLVVNAIQYTQPGGRVLMGCRRRGDDVVLEIWDTGVGIGQKDQSRIFEEFARADEARLGTGMGLGLSVVDRACRLMGHRLSVCSIPGRGSVFRIGMKRVQGVSNIREQLGKLVAEEHLSLAHIVLAIENDENVLFGTTRWLELQGASVFPAASTAEALSLVDDIGMAPDIILADFQLDGDDTGVEAIARVRERTDTQVPAIVITAHRTEDLRKIGLAQDFTVMAKPVRLPRLRALIDWKVRRAAGTQHDTDKSPK